MTMSDRLLGLLGGVLVLGAIFLLVVGGEDDTGVAATPAPEISVVSPLDGAAIAGPLDVVFRVPEDMTLQEGGWGIRSHHLHLSLDGVELMPAERDLERLGPGEYRWRVGSVDPGGHALQMLWSGTDHRPIPGTETPPTRFTVE